MKRLKTGTGNKTMDGERKMERLTENTPKGAVLKLDSPKSDMEAREQLMAVYPIAMNKLAAYEDSGLSPEEIVGLQTEIAALKEECEDYARIYVSK